MTIHRKSKPGTRLPDPRKAPDFHADFYPTANGKATPPARSTDANHKLVLEFLAAYYEINRRYARLSRIRAQRPSANRQRRERESLTEIEAALRHRDELEDRYTPHGLVAEPVMKNGFAVDLQFTFGNVDSEGRARNQARFSSATIQIALPPGVKLTRPPPPRTC
jgi:hypothetical protein